MLFMSWVPLMATSNSPNPNIFLTPNMISVDIEGFYVHLYHTQYTGARSMSVMAHPLCGQRVRADSRKLGKQRVLPKKAVRLLTNLTIFEAGMT